MEEMAGDPNADQRSPAIQKAMSVVELGIQASSAYKRDDLAKRLGRSRRRLQDPAFHVFVVGEFKQGKSSLVNALLNAPVCPVDDDIATATPTAVRYAEEASAAVMLQPPEGTPPPAGQEEPEPIRQAIPVEDVANYVTEAANPENQQRVHSVEVAIPRKMLADGLVIMDTPGVGGLGSAHSAATIGALPMADAVVFVSDSSQEFTAPELEFLKTAQRMCPNLMCVMTKTDFYPSWRKIRDINAGHLERHGIRTELVCVSSSLRIHALRNNDRELNQESGFPDLVGYLQNDIAADAEKIMVRNAVSDVVSVAGMLESQFTSERQALQQTPEQNEAAVNELSELKAKAQALKTSKWQQTLSDGVADLQSDLDHELRGRIRKFQQQADEAIEHSDPAETWEEFVPWMQRRVAEDVANTYAFMFSRGNELALQVSEHFGEDGEDLSVHLDMPDPRELVAQIDTYGDVDTDTMGTGKSVMTGARSAHGGMMMVGMLTSQVGTLALGAAASMFNPIAMAAGIFMGRSAVKQEKERQLQQRRNQAKQAHRKYTDEVGFVVNKDARDTLRRIQRQFRDFFTSRADEILKSTSDALNATQKAAQSDQETRKRRLKDVNAEIDRIGALRKRAIELAPELAETAGGK